MKTTLHDFLEELATWVPSTEEQIRKAYISEINTKNNTAFRRLINAWVSGKYDEDPNALHTEVINLLAK